MTKMEITKRQEKDIERLADLNGLDKVGMFERVVDIGISVFEQVAAKDSEMKEKLEEFFKKIREERKKILESSAKSTNSH